MSRHLLSCFALILGVGIFTQFILVDRIAGDYLPEWEDLSEAEAVTEEPAPEPVNAARSADIETYLPDVVAADWTEEEEYILAKICMAEAEGETTKGKVLVVCTVLNRVQSDVFPNTIKDVVFQPGQFSSTENGRYSRVEPSDDCLRAVELAKFGWDPSDGALFLRTETL